MSRLTRYVADGDFLRAHGRPEIFMRSFQLGVTVAGPDNTGVPGGTTLRTAAQLGLRTEVNGDIIVTDAWHAEHAVGGVVDITGLDLFGFLKVRTGRPLYVRKSRVRGSGPAATRTGLVDCNHGSVGSLGVQNVFLEECTLIPDFPSEWIDGVVGHDYDLYRVRTEQVVDFFGSFNAVRPTDPARVSIRGCYGANLAYFSPSETHASTDNRTHNDGWQIQGNSGHRMVGSTLLAVPSATVGNGYDPADPTAPAPNPYAPDNVTGQAIGITPNVSAVSDVVIEDNVLRGGAQTTTVIDDKFPVTGLTYRRNKHLGTPPLLTRSGIKARRHVLLQPGVGAVGMPTSTGLDSVNGNVDEAGDPVVIWRVSAGRSAGVVYSTFPATFPVVLA